MPTRKINKAKKSTTAQPARRRATNVSLQPTIEEAFGRKRPHSSASASTTVANSAAAAAASPMLNPNEFAGYAAPPTKRTVFGHHSQSSDAILSLNQTRHQRASVSGIDRENILPNLRVAASRDRLLEDAINPTFRCRPPVEPLELRLRASIPVLPPMHFGESNEVWNLMCWKEEVYQRDPMLWRRHPNLGRQMRMVLLDWMMEVCECETLHRETFYLSVDLFDRYMSKSRGIETDQLQLVGVTALFVASKIEEIYPPKIERFAYMTDGACTTEDIRMQELVLLKQLNWALSPVTAVHWLTVYLQLLNTNIGPQQGCSSSSDDLTVSRFDRMDFLNLVRVLDLCMMDVRSAQFSYGILAASIILSTYDKPDVVFEVTGFKASDLHECRQWMAPYLEVCYRMGEVELQRYEDVASDDSHNIQTRVENIQTVVNRVEQRAKTIMMQQQSRSPEFVRKRVAARSSTTIFPTPPPSNERPYPLSRPPNTVS